MQHIMAYAAVGGPFLVVLLDLLMARDLEPKRRWLGLALAAVGLIAVPLRVHGPVSYPLWLVLLPSVILLTHSGRMKGLGQFIAFFGWMALVGLMIGQLAPQLSFAEAGYLPMNIAYFLIPVLLLWHLWVVLPLVYDSLRGGAWTETGVPLSVRYGILAVIAIVSLAANVYFSWQLSDHREVMRSLENDALMGMRYELKMIDHWLTHRGEEGFADWEAQVLAGANEYREEAGDAVTSLRHTSVSGSSPLYFLARTIPEGITLAFEREAELSEEVAASLQLVIRTTVEALESAIGDRRSLSMDTYRDIVDHTFAELEGTEALKWFSVQYRPQR